MKKQAGISLSEILISLFLASLLITLLVQFCSSTKRQYLEVEEILGAGLDVQWISDLLSDSIRRAGFTPCLGLDQLQTPLQGLKIGNSPQQFIEIKRMHEHFYKIASIKNATQIVVSHLPTFNEKHPLLIADCQHAEVQHIAHMENHFNGALITLEKPLQFTYDPATYVGEFIDERWFIKKNIEGEESLHYRSVQTEEISSLVHSLTITNRLVQGKQFLEIVMGLDQGKTHKIMVLVRGS